MNNDCNEEDGNEVEEVINRTWEKCDEKKALMDPGVGKCERLLYGPMGGTIGNVPGELLVNNISRTTANIYIV